MEMFWESFGSSSISAFAGIAVAYIVIILTKISRKREAVMEERLHELESRRTDELLSANEEYIASLKKQIAELNKENAYLKSKIFGSGGNDDRG